MADIELVIKIPEDYYKAITEIPNHQCTVDMLIIKNGTPLPKGHGRLIDADVVIKKAEKWGKDNPNEYIQHRNADIVAIMQDETAIIEADKGEN